MVADRLNFYRFLSHFRCVHRGSFFSQMRTTSVRKLLPEAWGMLLPIFFSVQFYRPGLDGRFELTFVSSFRVLVSSSYSRWGTMWIVEPYGCFLSGKCMLKIMCTLYVQYGGCGGVVVSTLTFRSEGRWFDAQSLPLCCFLRHTQVYKWVLATYYWGVSLRWTSILFRGRSNTLSCFMLRKPG